MGSAPPSRRRDIDGLRAIAIALVLAYHAAPSVLPGGFIGVDVFFVISGYLITQILVEDQAPGRLRRFYERRLRRLAPALVVVLASVLLLGWLLLLPAERDRLAEHTVAATLFVANLAFWSEAGYFDSQAHEKPLLHLWSLGIEEQFYLLWPLLLWALLRRGWAKVGTTLLFSASLAAALVTVRTAPEDAFYLPWFRFWELAAGALVALWSPAAAESAASSDAGPTRNNLAVAALLTLGTAAWLIDPSQPFPSWNALAPVAATAVLLASGPGTWVARRILARPGMVSLGLVSYPLYLWHWPLLSFYTLQSEPDAVGRALAAAAAVGLAYLTFHGVERPLQRAFAKHTARTVRGLLAALAGLLVVALLARGGSATAADHAIPFYDYLQAERARDLALREAIRTSPCRLPAGVPAHVGDLCVASGPPEAAKVLLWGDSTATSWAPLVQTWAENRGLGSVVVTISGCPPLLGVRAPLQADCELADSAWKQAFVEQVRPVLVVLTARWGAYSSETAARDAALHRVTTDATALPTIAVSRAAMVAQLPPTLATLRRVAPVIVVLAPPDLLRPPMLGLPRGLEIRAQRQDHRAAQQPIESIVRELAAGDPGLAVLDPADLLCGDPTCEAILGADLVYQDESHVSAQGALLFLGELDQLARRLGV